MARKEIAPFPESDDRDLGYRTAKATIGAVPVIGGPLQELLEHAIGLPSEKRRVEWFKSIAEVIADVCKRVEGVTPRSLGQDEEFQSVVAAATEIALRNHGQEKLEALRNAVKHTAEGIRLDELLRNTFLSLVDRMSPLHMVVLRLHHDPSSSSAIATKAQSMWSGSFRYLLGAALPQCPGEVLDEVEADLVAERLTNSSGGMGTIQGLMTSHTTPRGKAFLQFIS